MGGYPIRVVEISVAFPVLVSNIFFGLETREAAGIVLNSCTVYHSFKLTLWSLEKTMGANNNAFFFN